MSDQHPANSNLDYSVRKAELRDFFKLIRLEKLCFGADSWPWIDILAALTFPETVRLVLEYEGELAGFIIGDRRRQRDLGWIASIAIHPDYRRQGLGSELLVACEQALNTSRIRLSLRPSNTGALKLYRNFGYAEVDRWRKYYRDKEDALVMEKHIEA